MELFCSEQKVIPFTLIIILNFSIGRLVGIFMGVACITEATLEKVALVLD